MTSGPPRYSMYPLVSCLTLRSLFPYTTLFRSALVQLHDRSPFPNTPQEIAELAAQVKDANFRIEIAEDGIHVYNRDGHHVAQDAFSLFPKLGIGRDAPHAFYLGAELMKAEIAWRLGKRYAQDEPLAWGA